jgi:hypothetical protein
MLPSNRRQYNTLDHRACPEGRAVTRQYAVPAIGSLFNIAQSPKPAFAFFKQSVFQEKGPRGFRRRSKSGRKRPGKGSDSGGRGSYRVAYLANQKASRIDEAQFPRTFRVFRVAYGSYRVAADHVGEALLTLDL